MGNVPCPWVTLWGFPSITFWEHLRGGNLSPRGIFKKCYLHAKYCWHQVSVRKWGIRMRWVYVKGTFPENLHFIRILLISLCPQPSASASPLHSLFPIRLSQVDLKPSEYTARAGVLPSWVGAISSNPSTSRVSPPLPNSDCPLSLISLFHRKSNFYSLKEKKKKKPAMLSFGNGVCVYTCKNWVKRFSFPRSPNFFPAVTIQEHCVL